MKPSYKRDMEHNYMILESPVKVQGSEYQIRMLLLNQIPGLLACNMRIMDGTVSFYYEITSRQPLTRIYEAALMNREDIVRLVSGIEKGMEGMKRYLLNPDHLVLNPDYVYMEPETREVWLCCLPFYEGQIAEEFQELTEFVLKHLDHSDSEAVILGYEIYSEAAKENYNLEKILRSIYSREQTRERRNEKKDWNVMEEKPEKEGLCEVEESVFPVSDREEMKKKKNWTLMGTCIFLFVSAGGICSAAGLDLTQTGGVLFLTGGVLVYFMQARSEKKKDKMRLEEKKKRRIYKKEPKVKKEKKKEMDKKETDNEELFREYQEREAEEDYGETTVLFGRETDGFAALISENPKEREHIVLRREISAIGKLKGKSDIVIPLPDVSRMHARIERREDGYYLTDLNSRNGTYVNEERLEANGTVKLKNGDVVGFASVRFFFQE